MICFCGRALHSLTKFNGYNSDYSGDPDESIIRRTRYGPLGDAGITRFHYALSRILSRKRKHGRPTAGACGRIHALFVNFRIDTPPKIRSCATQTSPHTAA